MSDTSAALRQLAEPWVGGEKIKNVIDRAAKRAGLKYWRAFDIWYDKARRVEDFEREQIAQALEQKHREAARNELHDLRTRIMRLESMLVQTDPDFHRETITALGHQRGELDRTSGVARSAMAGAKQKR